MKDRQGVFLFLVAGGGGGMFKTCHNVQVLGIDIQFSVRFSQEWVRKCVRSCPKL